LGKQGNIEEESQQCLWNKNPTNKDEEMEKCHIDGTTESAKRIKKIGKQ
jgi:hypothetical protein